MPQDLGPPRKIVNFGIRYVVRDGWIDDETIAFEHYMRTAELGHPESQYCLGLCYALGKGVEKSYDTAMHWFEQAATKDHPQSLYCKGMCACVCMYFLSGWCYRRPIELIIRSFSFLFLSFVLAHAKTDALFIRGICLRCTAICSEHGWGVPHPDFAVAVTCYLKASSLDHLDSRNNLGVLCQLGQGMVPQGDKAIEYTQIHAPFC